MQKEIEEYAQSVNDALHAVKRQRSEVRIVQGMYDGFINKDVDVTITLMGDRNNKDKSTGTAKFYQLLMRF